MPGWSRNWNARPQTSLGPLLLLPRRLEFDGRTRYWNPIWCDERQPLLFAISSSLTSAEREESQSSQSRQRRRSMRNLFVSASTRATPSQSHSTCGRAFGVGCGLVLTWAARRYAAGVMSKRSLKRRVNDGTDRYPDRNAMSAMARSNRLMMARTPWPPRLASTVVKRIASANQGSWPIDCVFRTIMDGNPWNNGWLT